MQLTRSAEDWANKLARECKKGHRPFSSWPEVARAENIAYLCESNRPSKGAVNAWIESPGHLRNVSIVQTFFSVDLSTFPDAWSFSY